MTTDSYTKLHVVALGMALGVTWGIGILIFGFIATFLNWGVEVIDILGSVYIGYESTVLGSFIGGLWGFIDAFIGGVIIAWLYNCFACHCCHRKSAKTSE